MSFRTQKASWALATCFLGSIATQSASAQGLPDRISDRDFWNMIATFSEPSGVFLSENFTSNEGGFQWLLPELIRTLPRDGAYIGVGPEQNFTYIAALHPRIAFIVDIRRQAMLQHLIYKALFEMSADRAGFLSLQFSRSFPVPMRRDTTADALFNVFDKATPDTAMFQKTSDAILDRLVRVHGFALSEGDSSGIRHVFEVMFGDGPHLSYSSRGFPSTPRSFAPNGGNGRVCFSGANSFTVVTRVDSQGQRITSTVPDTTNRNTVPCRINMGPVDYTFLMTETDSAGVQRSFLANEENYRTLKDLEGRNLLVPIVGDVSGPTALRAVGTYLRDHGATVTAYYTSNVEQYLFQNGVWKKFYENVGTLPLTPTSTFIRSFAQGARGAMTPRGSRVINVLSSMNEILAAVNDGRIAAYVGLVPFVHQ